MQPHAIIRSFSVCCPICRVIYLLLSVFGSFFHCLTLSFFVFICLSVLRLFVFFYPSSLLCFYLSVLLSFFLSFFLFFFFLTFRSFFLSFFLSLLPSLCVSVFLLSFSLLLFLYWSCFLSITLLSFITFGIELPCRFELQ